jgi:AcrR family transcriptional regulator
VEHGEANRFRRVSRLVNPDVAELVLDAAERLFFTAGFSRTSITQELRMSRKTFYRYFPGSAVFSRLCSTCSSPGSRTRSRKRPGPRPASRWSTRGRTPETPRRVA